MARKRKAPVPPTTVAPDPLGPPVPPVADKPPQLVDKEPVVTNPIVVPEPEPPSTAVPGRPWWFPTNKWIASTVGGAGTTLIMWATTGSWDVEETVAAITLSVTAFSTWLVPNPVTNAMIDNK